MHGRQCSLPHFRRWCAIFVHILSNICIILIARVEAILGNFAVLQFFQE